MTDPLLTDRAREWGWKKARELSRICNDPNRSEAEKLNIMEQYSKGCGKAYEEETGEKAPGLLFLTVILGSALVGKHVRQPNGEVVFIEP
jgi:hypothetical protein